MTARSHRLAPCCVVAIMLLVSHNPTAAAQEAGPVSLTLGDALDRAAAQSQRLAETRAREDGAHAAIHARQAAERPTLAVAGGYTRTNHVDEFGVPQPNGVLRVIYPDIPDNYYSRATLQWPIYTGGRTDALIGAAEAEARAAAADTAVARADLRLEVTRAYWALATAAESVRVGEASLLRADTHLRDIRSRFDNGLIPPNDVSAVEAQRARQAMLLIEARNLQRSVQEDLRRLTGLDSAIVPAESLGEGTPPTADAKSAALRAELQALDDRTAAAVARVNAVAASRKPSVALHGAADYANPNPRIFPRTDIWRTSWELGISATWTLWDGGRAAADVAEADAAARALRARRDDVAAHITTERRQRHLDLDSARAALVAAQAAVTSAAEARRVVGERFAVGVATSTEVLDADGMLLQVELDRTRARANIRLAAARLERALGQ